MYKEKLNSLIMEAMKAHDTLRTEAFRAIKTSFMNWQTSKENAGKEMTDADELQVLRKMVKERKDSATLYKDANREDLAMNELDEAKVIEELLPKAASEAEITEAFLQVKEETGLEAIKANMGAFIKNIKSKLPAAEGKLVANVVQKNLL